MQRRRFSCVCGGYEALAFSVLDETRVQGVFVRPISMWFWHLFGHIPLVMHSRFGSLTLCTILYICSARIGRVEKPLFLGPII